MTDPQADAPAGPPLSRPSSGPPGAPPARRPLVRLAGRSGPVDALGLSVVVRVATRRRSPLVLVVVRSRVVVARTGSASRRGPGLRAGGAPPGSRRTCRASSGESSGFGAEGARCPSRPVQALDGATERREDGLRELVGAHRRGARRLEAEGRPDRRAARARAGSGRPAGRAAEAQLEPAGVLEDEPGQRAGDGRAEARERRIGRRTRRPGRRRGS